MTALSHPYVLITADPEGVMLAEPFGYNSAIAVHARYCLITGFPSDRVTITQDGSMYTALIDSTRIEQINGTG